MTNLIGKRITVLDKGFIQLIDLMPHPITTITPEQAIVQSARVSYLGESKGEVQDTKLLRYLYAHNHTSPFEQVEFKFRICAPVVSFWHLLRHRTFNVNMQSGRYTEFTEDGFYTPSEWRMQSASNKQASDGIASDELNTHLTRALDDLQTTSYALYEFALSQGIAREMARLFLPAWTSYYTGIIKMDAHNLMHFLRLRRHAHAQYEIRVYADVIFENYFKVLLPNVAEWMEAESNGA